MEKQKIEDADKKGEEAPKSQEQKKVEAAKAKRDAGPRSLKFYFKTKMCLQTTSNLMKMQMIVNVNTGPRSQVFAGLDALLGQGLDLQARGLSHLNCTYIHK